MSLNRQLSKLKSLLSFVCTGGVCRSLQCGQEQPGQLLAKPKGAEHYFLSFCFLNIDYQNTHYLLLQALASTSATPGHTRAFHFFTINQPTSSAVTATSATVSATGVSTTNPLGTRANRSKVASNGEKGPNSVVAANAPVGAPITLKFVDVPGLGFAGTSC